MSWSIYSVGTPNKVVNDLKTHSERLTYPTKGEFDKALPNLIGLVELNSGGNEGETAIIKLTASGHVYEGQSRCQSTIEVLNAKI